MISDPRIAHPLGELMEICQTAEDWNHPITATGDVGGRSGKPGSRAPGEQQSEWFVRRLEAILSDALHDAQRAQLNCRPREAMDVAPRSIGGIEMDTIEPQEVKPHKRRVSVDVTAGRLVAKYSGPPEGRTE